MGTVKQIQKDNFVAFRESWCKVYCGRKNRTSRCPEDCKIRTLSKDTIGTFRIRDMLEVEE